MWSNQRPSKIAFIQSCDFAGKAISFQDEITEALRVLKRIPEGYGFDEIIINIDHKYTPYHQILQICKELLNCDLKVGQDVLVTPWIPSSEKEGPFRQLATLLSIMDANAKLQRKIKNLAVTDLLISLHKKDTSFLEARRRIGEILEVAREEYSIENRSEEFLLVPMIEQVPAALNADNIIENLVMGSERMGVYLNKMRVGFNLSEMAMHFSFIASYLATTLGMQKIKAYQEDSDYYFSVMMLGGNTSFRGNFSLDNIEYLANNFPYVETFALPSSILYNNSKEEVINIFEYLNKRKISEEISFFEAAEEKEIIKLVVIFGYEYQKSIKRFIREIYPLISKIPPLRGKVISIGEVSDKTLMDIQTFTFALQEEEFQKMLREMREFRLGSEEINIINFTATLYTLGLPPEIIGVGAALKKVRKKMGEEGLQKLIGKYFPGIVNYFNSVLRFTFPELTRNLISEDFREEYELSIDEVANLPGIKLSSNEDYGNLLKDSVTIMKKVFENKRYRANQLENIIIELGKIRKGLA